MDQLSSSVDRDWLFVSRGTQRDEALWELRDVLTSDAAFIAWEKEHGRGYAYTRACHYPRGPELQQEVYPWGLTSPRSDYPNRANQLDPRRPVKLRGCKRLRTKRAAWTSRAFADGVCIELLDRYLQRIRYTEIDRHRHAEFVEPLYWNCIRGRYRQFRFGDRRVAHIEMLLGYNTCYLNGQRFEHLGKEQWETVERLYRIYTGLNDLDVRARRAVQKMMQEVEFELNRVSV